MRTRVLTLLAIGMWVASPALGAIGDLTVHMSTTAEGAGNDIDPTVGDRVLTYADPSLVPAAITITLTGSATSGGTGGTNDGLGALFMDVGGSALLNTAQTEATADTLFVSPFTPAYYMFGMGFNLFTGWPAGPHPWLADGTGVVGGILGIGEAQNVSGSPPPQFGPTGGKMFGAFTSRARGANGLPPAPIADADLILSNDPNGPRQKAGTYTIDITNIGAQFWDSATGQLVDAGLITTESITINVLPEPATLLLLAPALLGVLRRRRI